VIFYFNKNNLKVAKEAINAKNKKTRINNNNNFVDDAKTQPKIHF